MSKTLSKVKASYFPGCFRPKPALESFGLAGKSKAPFDITRRQSLDHSIEESSSTLHSAPRASSDTTSRQKRPSDSNLLIAIRGSRWLSLALVDSLRRRSSKSIERLTRQACVERSIGLYQRWPDLAARAVQILRLYSAFSLVSCALRICRLVHLLTYGASPTV